ncbi:SOS response-associated peptidase [Sphingomonas sp. RB1R13]|uniref:SOS response-associated peptidase n=1 Tax=Sphingomonas sp. RB1R13 TaxID=3096159 RepID=UPI002FCABB61
MCNLYSMTATVDELRRMFGPFDGDTANLPPFDEIYPGKAAPVLRRGEGGVLRLDAMTWGFPGPAAARGRPVTNVRNLDSPFWRSALGNVDRRCIVPVTRFCEWSAEPHPVTKRKIKHWFAMHEGQEPLFAFAGLWRPGATDGSDGPYMAFLTCAPNVTVGAVHPKAMPVMLRAADALGWLSHDRETACALAIPFPDADMRLLDI